MKILHLLKSNHYSGAENVVCQIINMFQGDPEFEMAYCSEDGPIKDSLRERNINFFPLKILCMTEVTRVIREFNPDVIHAHDVSASIYAALTGRKQNVIYTIHGNDIKMRSVNAKSLLFCFASRKSSHIFWVSQSCLQQYRFKKFINSQSSVLYNVIDQEEIINKKNLDRNVYSYDVVYIGRLSPEKNPHRLIHVLELVSYKYPTMKCAIIGSGVLYEEVKKEISDKHIDNNVDMLGFMNNPYKVLSCSKVLVMTSSWEGTPMCALESMALGVPIVSTPTDGMCELVSNGETGYLCSDDNELASRIVGICTDNREHDLLSVKSRERFASINDMDNFYMKLKRTYLKSKKWNR